MLALGNLRQVEVEVCLVSGQQGLCRETLFKKKQNKLILGTGDSQSPPTEGPKCHQFVCFLATSGSPVNNSV